MSKRVDYRKKYSTRKHDDGSVGEIVFNYKNAFCYWRRYESSVTVSNYEIKFMFAGAVYIATFMIIDSCIHSRYYFPSIFVSIITFVDSNDLVNIELITLNIVSAISFIRCIPYNASDDETHLFSYYSLRNGIRNRPNFILEHDILNSLSDDIVRMYIEVFRIRCDSLKPEIDRHKTTETWTIIAIAVTVIMNYINEPNVKVLVVSIGLAALIAYFLENCMTHERFVLLTDYALYNMILQDLCDIRIKQSLERVNCH